MARLGYSVTGIDISQVRIDQMNKIAEIENLDLEGQVGDIFSLDRFDEFDIVLLDSMFHFAKKDKEKEIALIKRIVSDIKNGSIVIVCIQETGDKVQILNQAIDFEKQLPRLADKKFTYMFEDKDNGHKSETGYRMIVNEK